METNQSPTIAILLLLSWVVLGGIAVAAAVAAAVAVAVIAAVAAVVAATLIFNQKLSRNPNL